MESIVSDFGLNKSSQKTILNDIAGEDLSAIRIVTFDSNGKFIYADNNNLSHLGRVCGLTISSANTNNYIKVISYGIYENSLMTFTVGLPIYLGSNGHIIQVANTTGFICIVGEVITPTKIFLNIQDCILL